MNGYWSLGYILAEYIQATKKGYKFAATNDVEKRLKQIREETFKRMAEHPNNSLTWKQIYDRVKKHPNPYSDLT